ncbi:lithostathine-1-beta-like [Corythoichthys intestinalis]|uniref:lithostathine-1-beta-like n=1 Tax=Corythoichthys intestinalis TaxID=161448 RepID=UPI0025A617CD|nr:lithostathine-1-beta-like [Corythoichthys intestinalis]
MAFTHGLFFLLCTISALMTGVSSIRKPPKIDNNCPKGWTRLDCHCYIYEENPRLFADAEAVCNILGGNLVSIESALENAFVHEMFRAGRASENALWIGLHDAIENQTFLWMDGTDFDFINWDASDPDTSAGDCVTMVESDGEWEVASCSDSNPYICITDVSTH